MNNILSYNEYRDKVRLLESKIIYDYLDEPIEENIFTNNYREHKANYIVNKTLEEEIELGKQVEEKIKSTMKELSNACQKVNFNNTNGSDFKKSIEKIITDINNKTFDTLSLLGDADIDFTGFKKSAVLANIVNWGVLFSPIRNAAILRRAYKYFIGLIKQAIRKDLVLLLVNFDQFQNLILQKSMESEENARLNNEVQRMIGEVEGIYSRIIADEFGKKRQNLAKKLIAAFDVEKKKMEVIDRNNPMYDFFNRDDMYRNSADTLKNYIHDDEQKKLESYKNSISKLAHGNDDLQVYGEFLISAAEEKAYKTIITIHTNFLKLSEVFKLSNQKKLVELLMQAENENNKNDAKLQKEVQEQSQMEKAEKINEFIDEEGEKIFEGLKDYTLDEYNKLTKEVKIPDIDEKMSQKDILTKWFEKNPDRLDDDYISDEFKLAIIIDDNWDNTYLSYVDLLSDQINKIFIEEDDKTGTTYLMSFGALHSKHEVETIVEKLFNDKSGKYKVNDIVEPAFKLINSQVYSFNYRFLISKFEEMLDSYNKKPDDEKDFKKIFVSISKSHYLEFKDIFKKFKEFVDNDYKKSERSISNYE